jgi:hypothetical protein
MPPEPTRRGSKLKATALQVLADMIDPGADVPSLPVSRPPSTDSAASLYGVSSKGPVEKNFGKGRADKLTGLCRGDHK